MSEWMKNYDEPVGFAHLGKTWHYPFQHEADGAIKVAEHVDSVRSSVRFILDTNKGEIFMSPHIGTRLREILFMEINDVFFALAEEYTYQALREQEPRVNNIKITFSDKWDANAVTMYLSYDVVSTSIRDTLNYDLIRRDRL